MKTLPANHAWHFVGKTLRDGSPIPPDGETLVYKGPLEMCQSGLHWSRNPFDALEYAPGATLCLVTPGGTIIEPPSDNKGLSSERTIIARMDATELCRYFARMCALSVSHLWNESDDPNNIVLEWLMTGDESLRAIAWASAWASAWAIAWDSARAIAWDSARDSARASYKNEFTQLVYECFEDSLP